jgi:predicted small lipoprotein YifL
MRSSIVLIAAMLTLAACEHKGVNEFASAENVSVSPGTYAMASAQSNPPVVRQSGCADGYDDVITHLEKLMEKNKAQQSQ